MKIIFSEASPDYASYTFPYAVYAVQENPGETNMIYEKGFLPYSDHRILGNRRGVYYLTRSLRIRLKDFSLTSENRRIRRKMSDEQPALEIKDKETFRNDKAFWNFCRNYAAERIGDKMPPERLEYIFEHPYFNKIAVFSGAGGPVGYVWLVETDKIMHYWFAFFDTSLMHNGIGKWMMEQMISYAKENGKEFMYLGTCYGTKPMYKMRDFRAVEFFDGNRWNTDINLLKTKCKATGKTTDDFKLFPDRFI